MADHYGLVVFSIPWRGRRLGLVLLSDDRWFFGFFQKVSSRKIL